MYLYRLYAIRLDDEYIVLIGKGYPVPVLNLFGPPSATTSQKGSGTDCGDKVRLAVPECCVWLGRQFKIQLGSGVRL